MHINATNNVTPLPERARQVAEPSMNKGDAAVFKCAEALDQKLRETADIRSGAVARARALIVSPDYPPEKTMRSIANLLAIKLEPENE